MNFDDVDLKKTINLPRTDFSMKANLPQAEPKMLAAWQDQNLYARIRETSAGRPQFILHDGPPYANGNIHLGHVFNKVLKDYVVKSKTMAGFDSPYIPGWDCHGLPIEIKVDSELGSKKAQMSAVDIRRACRAYAAKYVELQKQDFMRLGIFGRWDNPYLTMNAPYEAVIAGAFVGFLDKGYIYKGLKPVNWCLNDRTALAEAEVEYEPHSSPSIWVRFALKSDPVAIDPALAGRKVYGLIWTTTPWTIPANMAIAYHPRFEYVAVEVAGDVYVVAVDLLKTTAEKAGWSSYAEVARFRGSAMEGAVFRHPFIERDSKGILAEHVTLEQGTGAVHTAPGHGHEDYVVARQYNIFTYCPVDDAGRFFHAEGAEGRLPEELIGKTVWQANPIVIDILRSRGALLAQETVNHSYPHCWRCHKPTIFRATEQWFIGMDRNNFRQAALEETHKVKWMPAWGDERMSNMLAARPDWCISRQRVWGVPIIALYCAGCRAPITDKKLLDHVVGLFAQHSSDVWYERTATELLPPGSACPECGGGEFIKENDIIDVWFESGCSHLAVLTPENNLPWPSDVYLEGADQFRGWFQSSLLVGTGLKGGSPYRSSVTNGWTLDGEGRAMSKSIGNVIEPAKIVNKYGAEILRLWVASVEFNEDVRLSDTILERLADAYRKLRNTFRYTLGNLWDFDPARDAVPGGALREIDQYILLRAEELVARCRVWYNDFAFHKVYHEVYNFCTVDLSSIYFDVIKDRLYTSATRSKERRSAQTALYRLTHALVRLLAPIMVFTTEEAWVHFKRKGSVHTQLFPDPSELTEGIRDDQRKRAANWDRLMDVRGDVLKSLETARQTKFIGAGLEARVNLAANRELYPLLEEYSSILPELFIVSQVALANHSEQPLAVTVERAAGEKCARCWKYTTDVGSNAALPTICAACARAVEEILGS